MKKIIALLSLSTLIAFFLVWNNVYLEPTDEDRKIIVNRLSSDTHPNNYAEEIELIKNTQRQILTLIKHDTGIPYGQSRNVKDLVHFGKGVCFDAARFIEIAMRTYHFEARRVAIYKTKYPLEILYKKPMDSHAMTEIKTSRGWLLVDSITPWVALTKNDAPMSVDTLDMQAIHQAQMDVMGPGVRDILSSKFIRVYGLYSRHGFLYPPFLSFPDVNWSEFMGNVL